MDEHSPSGQTKRCSRCGEVKPLGEFPPTGGGRWRRGACRRCCTEQTTGAHRRAYTPAELRPQMPEGATARCADCEETKPAAEFNLRAYYGRVAPLPYCRACQKARAAARYQRLKTSPHATAKAEGAR